MKNRALEITSFASSGHGIADNGWHVLGSIPGDTIVAKSYKKVDDITYAEMIEIVSPSEHRTISPDTGPYFNPNAPWEHMESRYEDQVKLDILKGIFQDRSLKLENPALIHSGTRSDHYRNKAAYAFTKEKDNKLAFALFTRGIERSGKVSQEENILVHENINKVGKQFLHFFNQKNVGLRDIKYLTLRYSYLTNTVVAHILVPETNRKKIPWKKADLKNLLKQNPKLQGVLVSHSEPGTRSAATTKDFYAVGNIELIEKVLDKEYTYHPSQFFQIYPEAFGKILSDCREIVSSILNHQEYELLDFFAGIGIIGLGLSDLVKSVHGVEQSPLAKKYANKNKRNNEIENFSFTEANVDEALDFIQPEQILVVDPARSGLTKKSLEKICSSRPKYIIYISCNPETQARDYQQIQEHYGIHWSRAYNLFPKTPHIEHVIFMKRKNN